ncbi:MAG: O-antigen ligase family protein [Opitutae bacterium]|nr:O-antigen ligase family protein [Opitutae bacterium]
MWPALFAAICLAAIAVRVSGRRLDIVVLGALIVGYIVGNRGFAQLMPAPGLPLLPAEAGLLIAGGWLIVSCALQRRLPLERDALNYAVLLCILVGTARVLFDLKPWGLVAVRDFATVYYAGFFFIAQAVARDPAARRFLLGSLLVGVIVLLPMYALSLVAPEFFLTQLTVRGVPLIFYKGDLVYTFLMAGSTLLFHWAEGPRQWHWRALSAVLFIAVVASDSRASLAGGIAALGLLGLRRRWNFARLQLAATLGSLLLLVALAVLVRNDWAERKVDSAVDRVSSMVDVTGRARYRSDDSYFRSDNNRFRLVWWTNVVRETWAGNPVFGLGFGHDLASRFVREYYPEASEDSSTRSPHNLLVTVFGRMGFVGLIAWLALMAAMLRTSLQVLANEQLSRAWGLAVAPWVVWISACFGVVLEGPMAAVPFWIMLGLLNAERRAQEESQADGAATGRKP